MAPLTITDRQTWGNPKRLSDDPTLLSATALMVKDSIAQPLDSALKEILSNKALVALYEAPKIHIQSEVCVKQKSISSTGEPVVVLPWRHRIWKG